MASRLGQITSHLDPRTWSGKGLSAHSVKNDDDVVIVASGRTAFCKAKKGQLKDTPYVTKIDRTIGESTDERSIQF